MVFLQGFPKKFSPGIQYYMM